MPPSEAVLKGKAAVRAWYDRFLTRMRTTSLTIADREVFMEGEWATEVAIFEWVLEPVAGGPVVTDRGGYAQGWHHEPGGQWLFARELWNSTAPAVTPSAEP